MSLNLIDSHTHIDASVFDEDREGVLERARKVGLKAIINIGASDEFQGAERSIKLAEENPDIWASAGIHPHDAGTALDEERLLKLAQHPRVVAIGETGLDFFKDWSPRPAQEAWFRLQVQIARKVQKPLIIHCRAAADECLAILKSENAAEVGGVFHCFAETAEFARALKDINFMVSFPGIVSFKKAENIHAAAREIPLEQIMIETDAPYLAPEPYRGKRCEPAFILETAQALANLKGLSIQEVADTTARNAIKFYKLTGLSIC